MSTNLQVPLFQEEHKEAPPDLGQAADPKWPIGYMQCHQGAMAEPPPPPTHTHNLVVTSLICKLTHLFSSAMTLSSFSPFSVAEVKLYDPFL